MTTKSAIKATRRFIEQETKIAPADKPTTPYVPPAMTKEDRESAIATMRRSLAATHAVMSEALSVPCPQHGARRGESCFHIKAVCWQRVQRSRRAQPVVDPPGLGAQMLHRVELWQVPTKGARR